MLNDLKEIRKAHERIGRLLAQMEAAEVPTVEHDPLEGKAVEGFSGGCGAGLNHDEHHLCFSPTISSWKVSGLCDPAPHHLTRVTERTVGRFYLLDGCAGDSPKDFGLYLGDKWVQWTGGELYPIYVSEDVELLSLYEVTPTEQ